MEPPTISEGFREIKYFHSFKDVNNFLDSVGCDISSLTEENHDHIVKFVRTQHLINTGSASRDDLVYKDISGFINVPIYVEEKVDGSNMGISIRDYKIMVQNRNHYITSSYHSQYKYLDVWIDQHMQELWQILEDESKILYGEWCYATHSIHYTSLPDTFIVFDLFDRTTGKFYSRSKLEETIQGTTLKIIPIIKYGIFSNINEIKNLVTTKSSYYDGQVEVVYLRKCNSDWLEYRAKIVRDNFVCGNEQWQTNNFKKNIIL